MKTRDCTSDKSTSEMSKIRDHLANERTFLAWIRTSIGLIAFGFVVEKFSLFLKQLRIILTKSSISLPPQYNLSLYQHLPSYSASFGIALVILGTLISLLAFLKYKQIREQISSNQFKPTNFLNFTLTLIIFLTGFILAIYLIVNLVNT
ncbi:YidH family protein [Legionella gresilensis]|uniref:YidH family protein n=1 Tax=Legionella gresilensis TaxID=91823 RepID=UPI001A9475D8|nr:DUF202 domain-containing protein [Legionella gresilensis]